MKHLLERVAGKVYGDRQNDYGHPSDNHECTAALWRAYLGRRFGMDLDLSVQDVCQLNILQKSSRLANTPDHVDSLEDQAGYAENADRDLRERSLPDAPAEL